MRGTQEDKGRYPWQERRWYLRGAPEGKCWTVREMTAYGTSLDRFIPHLQAMAEGLEQASYESYDIDIDDPCACSDDNDGHFVVGLRALTEDDVTEEQQQAIYKRENERALLVELMGRHPDVVAQTPHEDALFTEAEQP